MRNADASGGAIARSLLAAVLLAALAGFVTLLLAIVALVVAGMAGGHRPDMSLAYRAVAAPVALAMLPVAFIAYRLWERRHPAIAGFPTTSERTRR